MQAIDRAWRVAAAAALAVVALAAGAAPAPAFTGRCVGVLDGDSIEVRVAGEARQIRLHGIDAPERGQAFSSRAKQELSNLVFGRDVVVAGSETDQYGRLVARVRVGDLDVNLEMVRRGLAWHYRRYSSDPALAEAESAARAGRVGLWVDRDPLPPWSFRRRVNP
jgi:endonuclease YncB( thermonuclease family)